MQKKKAHTGNAGLFVVVAIIYVGILLLFAWQTWSFVDWLFPSDQLLMKLLTVLCFDIMALIWACLDLFYHHATRGARTLIRWAWAISFILSLIASIFYLVLESILRFKLEITPVTVDIGYGVTIVAVTETVLFVTFWLYIEWSARHPHEDDFEYDFEKPAASTSVQFARTRTQTRTISESPQHPLQGPDTSPLAQPNLDVQKASQNGNH